MATILKNAIATEPTGQTAVGTFTLNSKTTRGHTGPRQGRFLYRAGCSEDPRPWLKITLRSVSSAATRNANGSFTLNSKTARYSAASGGVIGRLNFKAGSRIQASVQTVTLPGVPSGGSIGSLSSSNRNTIGLPGVPSGGSIGSLNPANRRFVSLPGVPSGGSVGGLTVLRGQGIELPGVPSPLAIGDIRLGLSMALPGVPSALAIGALNVGNQNQPLPGVPSSLAIGALTVLREGIIGVPGIPTGLVIGVLKVAGPVNLPSVSTGHAIGALVVRQAQGISLPGVPSALAFGVLRVKHVQTVTLPGVASSSAIGDIIVKGGGQLVLLPSVITGRAIGALGLVGGDQALEFYVGGYRRTNKLLASQPVSVTSQTIGRWSAGFTLYDSTGTFAPALGQTVIIKDGGRKLFAGCIASINIKRPLSSVQDIFYTCTALDKASICDHRVANKTYPAGSDGSFVARDLVASFLNGEGLTTLGIPDGLGTLDAELAFSLVTVTEAFDRLSDLLGCVWFVNVDGDLTMKPTDQLDVCPFEFTETSKNWRDLVVSTDLIDFRTKEYGRSNLNLLPGDGTAGAAGGSGGSAGAAITETYTLGAGGQDAAFSAGLEKGYILLNFPIFDIVSVKVNDVSQLVSNALSVPFYNPPGSVPGDSDFIKSFYFYKGLYSAQIIWPNDFLPGPAHGTGAVVEVKYIPFVQNAAVSVGSKLTPTPPLGPPLPGESFGTCGSGIYEHVTQLNDVTTENDMNAILAAILEKSNVIPVRLSAGTDEVGAYVGQLIHVDIPRMYLPDCDLLITGMSGAAYPVDLGRGSKFRWTLDATNSRDLGNATKWVERLVRRTVHPQPVAQYDEYRFALEPGGSISSGTPVMNPSIVGRTGRLYEALVSLSVPPADQDLVLDVVSASVGSLFGNDKIVVPAGTVALDLIVSTTFAQAFLYKNDRLTITYAYRVRGPNPTAAGSGTLTIRVAI